VALPCWGGLSILQHVRTPMQDCAGSWESYTSLFTLLINDEDGAYACHPCDPRVTVHLGTAFQTVGVCA
jgi:hypothetical protein